MPIFTESDTLDSHNVGHFGYTAVPVEDLQASQFTLATIAFDCSLSTSPFFDQMLKALKDSIRDLAAHPLKDQMLVRVVAFSDDLEEIHGFIPVSSIDVDQYDKALAPRGMTACYDACISASEATVDYSRTLAKKRFLNNGIFVVITDGLNNAGRFSSIGDVGNVADAFKAGMMSEELESNVTILVTVNVENDHVKKQLEEFHSNAKFTQPMIDVKHTGGGGVGRVGGFLTSSISSTSMALGTGGPSQSLQF